MPFLATPTATPTLDSAPPMVDEVLRSSGQQLEAETRAFMEPRFGHDFSRVRVHTQGNANTSAHALNALAYTVGADIVFGAGQYSPGTTQGRQLLAHELTHVIQQGFGSRDVGAPLQPAPADRGPEDQADRVAHDVIFGDGVARGSVANHPLSLQRACGKEIGKVEGCTGISLDVTGPTFLFKVGCDDFLPGEGEKLQKLLNELHPADVLAVHGFASEEGSFELNSSLSCLRAKKAISVLEDAGLPLQQIGYIYEHGGVSGPRAERRSVVIEIYKQPRGILIGEQRLLDRLAQLGVAAKTEPGGAEFQKVVDAFRKTLTSQIDALNADQELPKDVDLVMKALMLWSQDPGNKWGEGSWDSNDLVMTAADYVTVPASQYKCNAFVAEAIYQSLRLVFLVHEAAQARGQYFPYQAREWGDTAQVIPKFAVVQAPKMGDVWSNGTHTGIYLGEYEGKKLYISARDDGKGVFALDKVQKEHGVQIKYLADGGVYRRYTP